MKSIPKKLSNGDIHWYLGDNLHREDGPAIELANNRGESWWIHGLIHRVGGPAVIYGWGERQWWINGKRHREDGPAIVCQGLDDEWWIDGVRLSPEKESIMNVWYENGRI